jgi:DNA topoisomerase-1
MTPEEAAELSLEDVKKYIELEIPNAFSKGKKKASAKKKTTTKKKSTTKKKATSKKK